MDSDTRLKALARLAQSQTDAAKTALQSELASAEKNLSSQEDYDLLNQSLSTLEVIGYRFSEQSVRVLAHFLETIERRELRYSEQEKSLIRDIAAYKNAESLILRAIEVLGGLRYLQTESVIQVLFVLASHGSSKVRKKASEALEALAGYNLDAFYGEERNGGIGATPQKVAIEFVERLSGKDLVSNLQPALMLLTSVLSPTMEGASWSSRAVTLSRGETPPTPDVISIRSRSIGLLKRLYGVLDTIESKSAVIDALMGATRLHYRGGVDEQARAMIARDALEVLAFYAALVRTEDLAVVQKIESHSYWIHVHAFDDDVKAAALGVEREIARHDEYQIYRVLIGFEGIFGDWQSLARSDRDPNVTDEARKRIASEYAASVTGGNYGEWRERIIKYAQTKSDDLATFPIFYFFLERFANISPRLALRLVEEDVDSIESFLIPLLRGLWAGADRAEARRVIHGWIERARETGGRHLFASAKLFLANNALDIDLLKAILAKAAELKSYATVRQLVSVAIVNYRSGDQQIIEELFLPALEVLCEAEDPGWIFDAWFRPETREVLVQLDERAVRLLLNTLSSLPKIDYHAEAVFQTIAERMPDVVLEFFCRRIEVDKEMRHDKSREFEAVPFEFHKLQGPLSRVPELAVRRVRELFRKDRSLFSFRGARLLTNIFPKMTTDFEAELLKLIATGDEQDYMFVIGVLRNYQGEVFIHHLCKELVKSIPAGSPLEGEIAIALETTGMVSGEYGFAEAYERKRKEVVEWLSDPNERVREFAEWYIADLERMRDAERKRADEDIALRKFRYREDLE